MIGVNLIPRRRLERQRLRRRTWLWTSAVGMYAAFLVLALVVSNAIGKSDDRVVRAELVEASSVMTSTELSLSTLREQLDQAAALYFANLEVGSQPDWGVLLALLARTTGDEIVLRGCRLKSVDRAPAAERDETQRGAPDEVRVQVELSGVGRSQQHVSDFLLRMEDNALFKEVKLQDTRREPFLDGHAVAFSIEFALDDAGESQ